MINLIHGDCLIEMKNIPDKSVDMVLADVPYGTTACKWDVIIPFEPMWNELKRITKDNGAICLFGSEPFSSRLRLSNLKMFKYDWIWKKTSPSNWLDCKKRPMGIFEVVSVFSQKSSVYYPQGLVQCNKKVTIPNNHSGAMFKSSGRERIAKVQEFTNYPKNILEFKKDGKLHTSQKPVSLLEYLIKTYTIENETVLDFTMGSGSTGVACKNLNRNFIGIERDDKYFEIAKQRIESSK
jgi:site-specific DNA-methyltransferase (adenine-specific)